MPLLDCDLGMARKLFDVNVFGVIGTIQAFSSLLIAAQGTIVIIGSVGGVLPYPFGGTSFPCVSLINQKGSMAPPNRQSCTSPTSSGSKCIRSTSKSSTSAQEVSKAKLPKTRRRIIIKRSLAIQYIYRLKSNSKPLKLLALKISLTPKCMQDMLSQRSTRRRRVEGFGKELFRARFGL